VTVLEHHVNHGLYEAVLRSTEPTAAVYLLGQRGEPRGEDWPTRWSVLADSLRRQGADDETVAVLGDALGAREGEHGMAFARNGELLSLVSTPGAVGEDRALFGAPAHLVPLLQWQQDHPPYVLAVVDAAGAVVEASIGAGSSPVHATVEGAGTPEATAALVADAVVASLHRVESRVLLLAGEPRTRHLVHQELPLEELAHLHVVHGDDVAAVVRGAVAARTDELWQRFLDERSPAGLAVEGAHETLAALAAGTVSVLFVQPRAAGALRAWFGPVPCDVVPVGGGHPVAPEARQGPLVDVAVRAALLTGARVRVIPTGLGYWPMEGVAGLTRFR
jgi:hypothetical protein